MRILIAEDETIIAHDLRGILGDFGHDVVGMADTADDVLAAADRTRPDLVLLDIHLRGAEDGIAVGQILRDRFQTPVVYLTAHTDAATVQRAIVTEPYGYLAKPFNEQTLQSTLEVAYYKHQMEQQRRSSAAALRDANSQLSAAVAALERRTTEVAVLSALGGALFRCATVEESYAVVADAARRLFSDADGTLYIQRLQPPSVEAVATWGVGTGTHPPLHPGSCRVMRSGRVWIELESDEHCVCPGEPHDATRPAICVPLAVDDHIRGVLHLRLPNNADTPDAQPGGGPRGLATALAEQAALGLDNVRMRVALREQVVRDPLTGLFNRRYLEETLAREQARAARGNYPISIMLLDIDHFKRINDTWGHPAGDAVLCALGRLLMTSVRAEDVVCRYGGEEFVLVLPSAPPDVTLARSKRLHEQVLAMRVDYEGRELPPISVSVGIASISERTADIADVLRRADAALYRAKGSGRNCTVVG